MPMPRIYPNLRRPGWMAVICLALLAGACATGEDGGNELASDRECRTFDTAGSKMRRSVCMTAEEWAMADARQRDREATTDEFFRRALEQGAMTEAPAFDSPTGAP